MRDPAYRGPRTLRDPADRGPRTLRSPCTADRALLEYFGLRAAKSLKLDHSSNKAIQESAPINPKPAIFSQESSARSLRPGIVSKESSAKSLQPGVLSQESSQSGVLSLEFFVYPCTCFSYHVCTVCVYLLDFSLEVASVAGHT